MTRPSRPRRSRSRAVDVKLLDETLLAQMAANPAISKDFSFLKLQLPKKDDGCCGKKAPPAALNYNVIKQHIATMPLLRQQRFVQLSGYAHLRVIYKNGDELKDVVISG